MGVWARSIVLESMPGTVLAIIKSRNKRRVFIACWWKSVKNYRVKSVLIMNQLYVSTYLITVCEYRGKWAYKWAYKWAFKWAYKWAYKWAFKWAYISEHVCIDTQHLSYLQCSRNIHLNISIKASALLPAYLPISSHLLPDFFPNVCHLFRAFILPTTATFRIVIP